MKENEMLSRYLMHHLPESKDWVNELEEQAERYHAPILDAVTMQFIMQLLRLQQPHKILEIGTAIGYSTLRMLEACPDSTIVTIERDERRYKFAQANFARLDPHQTIHLIEGDAVSIMEELIEQEAQFDFIFIDAAKGQYQNYFKLADVLLANHGCIIADNVLFRGYVTGEEVTHPRFKTIVRRLQAFNQWVAHQPHYETSIVPMGDGLLISYKRNEGVLRDE